jgi:hypothetical protein
MPGAKDAASRQMQYPRFHESVHALGVDYRRYTRPQAEVIVEATTLVVLGGLGLDVSGETVPYVAGWGEDGALDAVREFAATIDALARRLEDALRGASRAGERGRRVEGATPAQRVLTETAGL